MPFINGEGLEVVKEIFSSKFAGKNADGAVVSVGADYAEYGDWYDGNTANQDRKGYFVTMHSGTNQIEKANSASAIVGVTTDSAGFIGNYVKGAETDKSKGLVGIVGQVSVIDDGTCQVGGRCMPNDQGTASPSSNNCGYLVIERIDASHVRILVSPTIDMVQRIRTDMDGVEDAIGEIEGRDYIEASGTHTYGTWVKFSNGLAIVTFKQDVNRNFSQFGNQYRSTEPKVFEYPFKIEDSVASFTGGGEPWCVAEAKDTFANVYAYGASNVPKNVLFRGIVTGRWK